MHKLLVAISLIWLWGSSALAEPRIALVIGNNDYPANLGRLELAHRDAQLIANSLAEVGFDVALHLDADEDEMEDAILSLLAKLEANPGAIVFFYYSGHGVSSNIPGAGRVNLLVPAREEMSSRSEIFRRSQRLDELLTSINMTDTKAAFIVSDACREEFSLSDTRGRNKGFEPEPQRPGMLVAFATSAGGLAPDDGAFANALAEQIKRPGQDASVAFVRTLQAVARERQLGEMPFMAPGYIPEDVCFAGCTLNDAPPSVPEARVDPVRPTESEQTPDVIEVISEKPRQKLPEEEFADSISTMKPVELDGIESDGRTAIAMRRMSLRQDKGMSATLAIVEKGDPVEIIQDDPHSDWYLLKTKDGSSGWTLVSVPRYLLIAHDDDATSESILAEMGVDESWRPQSLEAMTLNTLDVFDRASDYADTIYTLRIGDIVEIVGHNPTNGWMIVKSSDGFTGFAKGQGQFRILNN